MLIVGIQTTESGGNFHSINHKSSYFVTELCMHENHVIILLVGCLCNNTLM